MKKIYVIGPNINSFYSFLREQEITPHENKEQKKFVYVDHPNRLKGLKKPQILLLEGWTRSRTHISIDMLEFLVLLDK